MQLFSQQFGNHTQAPLIILHGLFGSSNNWRQIAQALAQDYCVYTLDLRNHGRSPHADSMHFSDMAADVLAFMQNQQLPRVHLLGHSMGGKVAMQLALEQPDKVDTLIVADIAPRRYAPRHTDVFQAIEALDGVEIQSRKQAEEHIRTILPEQATRLFLLTNLSRDQAGHLNWHINMEAIRRQYEQISAAPQAAANAQFTGTTVFIRGALSNYIQDQDWPTIQTLFPHAQLVTLADAGHWLHIQQPQAFLQTVQKALETRRI